jgi:hypothetical protein
LAFATARTVGARRRPHHYFPGTAAPADVSGIFPLSDWGKTPDRRRSLRSRCRPGKRWRVRALDSKSSTVFPERPRRCEASQANIADVSGIFTTLRKLKAPDRRGSQALAVPSVGNSGGSMPTPPLAFPEWTRQRPCPGSIPYPLGERPRTGVALQERGAVRGTGGGGGVQKNALRPDRPTS